jgi:chromosome segregation ATPase
VTGAAERPVRISPLLDGRVLPRAETAVHGGSWDHRAEKLERSPNRRLYPVLLRQTVAGLADIDGLLGGLTSGLAENVQADGLLADIQNAADAANQKIGDLKKKVEEAETSAKQAARQEWQRILEAVTSERTTVQGKAATLDQRFADLQEEARMHAVREPKDAAHQEEAERIRKALEETRTERQPLKIRLQELDALEQRVRRQMGS